MIIKTRTGGMGKTRLRLNQVVLTTARLIERRTAREHFAALSVANNNRDAQDAEDGAGED